MEKRFCSGWKVIKSYKKDVFSAYTDWKAYYQIVTESSSCICSNINCQNRHKKVSQNDIVYSFVQQDIRMIISADNPEEVYVAPVCKRCSLSKNVVMFRPGTILASTETEGKLCTVFDLSRL